MRAGYLYVTCLCITSTPVILSMQVWCQLCSGPCQCPPTVPRCPVGVPLMLDSCACCRVCARQEGEACTDWLPCDTHRGLQCDYSASFPGGPGQCVGVNRIHSSWNTFVYTRAANTSNTKHLCIIITFKSKRQRSIILTHTLKTILQHKLLSFSDGVCFDQIDRGIFGLKHFSPFEIYLIFCIIKKKIYNQFMKLQLYSTNKYSNQKWKLLDLDDTKIKTLTKKSLNPY